MSAAECLSAAMRTKVVEKGSLTEKRDIQRGN
jgi:hypothetical protein